MRILARPTKYLTHRKSTYRAFCKKCSFTSSWSRLIKHHCMAMRSPDLFLFSFARRAPQQRFDEKLVSHALVDLTVVTISTRVWSRRGYWSDTLLTRIHIAHTRQVNLVSGSTSDRTIAVIASQLAFWKDIFDVVLARCVFVDPLSCSHVHTR